MATEFNNLDRLVQDSYFQGSIWFVAIAAHQITAMSHLCKMHQYSQRNLPCTTPVTTSGQFMEAYVLTYFQLSLFMINSGTVILRLNFTLLSCIASNEERLTNSETGKRPT